MGNELRAVEPPGRLAAVEVGEDGVEVLSGLGPRLPGVRLGNLPGVGLPENLEWIGLIGIAGIDRICITGQFNGQFIYRECIG